MVVAQTEMSSPNYHTITTLNGYDKVLNEDPDFPGGAGEVLGFTLETIEANIRIYVMTPLCTIGVIFNVVSIGVLFSNKLRLRKSLIQLFAFLNTFDA